VNDIDDILAGASPNRPEPAQLPAPDQAGQLIPAVRMTATGLKADSIEGLFRLARAYFLSGTVPESLIKGLSQTQAVARVLVILEEAERLGISPRAAMKNITVIRGVLTMWGDLPVAMAMRHRDWGGIKFEFKGDLAKGDRVAAVTVCRKGCPDVTHTFSQADAKRAGLGGNVWSQYTDRMLFNRARAFALRDQFADALNGMDIGEEAAVESATVLTETGDAIRMLQADR
jgi:hypothetical protein